MAERLRRAAHRLAEHPEVFALVPLVAAAARAVATRWIPVGENSVISLRAADVLTADHPWLGTASSVSVSSGRAVNHPGPALFDLLALPVKLLGAGPGVVFGVLILHSVAIVVAVVAARRTGGRAAAALVAAACLGLSYSLGPELVLDPWNPHVLLLPLLALMATVTAVLAGRSELLAWALAFGSLVLQIHVSTALVVPLLLVLAAAAAWRARATRRVWAGAVAVLTAFWVQPMWQQLFGPGDGNLWALFGSGGGGGQRVGLGLGARLVAAVVAVPPFWLRPSFERTLRDMPLVGADGDALPTPGWLVGGVVAAVLLTALMVGLGALAWAVARRGHRGPASACSVAVVALVASVTSAASIPREGYGVAPHQLRFLWPVGLWAMVAAAWAAWLLAPARLRSVAPTRLWSAVGAGLAVAAVLCMPSYPQAVGVARATPSMDDVRELVSQMKTVELPPVRLAEGGLWIGEPFTIPVLEAVWRRDQPVWVDDAGGSQFGRRRVSVEPVGAVLYLRAGSEALTCEPGSIRVALVTPLDAAALADPTALAAAAETVDVRTVAVFVVGDDGAEPSGVVGAQGAACP